MKLKISALSVLTALAMMLTGCVSATPGESAPDSSSAADTSAADSSTPGESAAGAAARLILTPHRRTT